MTNINDENTKKTWLVAVDGYWEIDSLSKGGTKSKYPLYEFVGTESEAYEHHRAMYDIEESYKNITQKLQSLYYRDCAREQLSYYCNIKNYWLDVEKKKTSTSQTKSTMKEV